MGLSISVHPSIPFAGVLLSLHFTAFCFPRKDEHQRIVAQVLLKIGWSSNALIVRGRMFIFSHSHLKVFLAIPDDWSPIGRQLLDIGAGDGAVTAKFASFFASIYVVEASKVFISQRDRVA